MTVTLLLVYNVRSALRRWASSLVAVTGMAGAVAVFVSVMALAHGFQAALVSTGSGSNALTLRGGSTSELESALTIEQARVIGDAPGVARDGSGRPLVSPEVVVIVALPKPGPVPHVALQARGVTATAFEVHEGFRFVLGRAPRAGVAEIAVGKNVAGSIDVLRLDSRARFGGRDWDVVGVFDAGGSAHDSEVLCDASLLAQAFDRPQGLFQSVTARLQRPESLAAFKDWVTANPVTTASVERETDYYARQSSMLTGFIRALGLLVAAVMGLGAVAAALNTMVSAVSARSREIATLRALGFGPGSVVLSIVLESVLVATIAGLAGGLLALPLNGFTVSTMNWQTWSQVAFAFRVTPSILLMGLGFAVGMGLIGGLLPAIRAARLPIVAALREL
jgi:putative ABC transport system permease protein